MILLALLGVKSGMTSGEVAGQSIWKRFQMASNSYEDDWRWSDAVER
jgi:hypothetical protein